MPFRLLAVIGIALAIVIVGAVINSKSPTASSSNLPNEIPFTRSRVRHPSQQLNLSSYKGKPVVLNFYASWCPPCVAELPMIASKASQVGSKIQFIGVDVHDTRANATKLLAASGVNYPSAFDPNGQIETQYALVGTPTTFFINAKGQIIGKHVGEMTSASLDKWIKRLQNPKAS